MADKTTGKLKLWLAKITDKISDTINIYLSENFSKIDDEFSGLKDDVDEHKAEDASTTAKGHVQLSSSTSSTSTSLAATASAVKTVNDEAKAYTDAHEQKAAPHSGHETPAGAQAKADAAETNAKSHANGLVGILSSLATTAKNNIVAAINEIHSWLGQLDNDFNTHQAESASHVKPARTIIGTSASGWTAKDCDYLCDGTNDQEEIIQALNDLPATGGEVVILDGTYNITASIHIPKDNVSLRGNGNATILKRMYNSTNTDSGPTAKGLITLNEKSGCKIQGLQIDGNKATYTANYNYGIYLYPSSSENTITGNTCNNSNYGIYLHNSSRNTVTGNTCSSNSGSGIYLHNSSNDVITGNACNNNSYGIYLRTSSNNNTITGNTCYNNYYGIYLSNSSRNIITGNICFRGTGSTTDYIATQYTIQLSGGSSSYNLVSNNNCMGKAVVVEGTGNSVWGNKYDSGNDLP